MLMNATIPTSKVKRALDSCTEYGAATVVEWEPVTGIRHWHGVSAKSQRTLFSTLPGCN